MHVRSSASLAFLTLAAATATLYAPPRAQAAEVYAEEAYQEELVSEEELSGEAPTEEVPVDEPPYDGSKFAEDFSAPEPGGGGGTGGGGGGTCYPHSGGSFSTLFVHGYWKQQPASQVNSHSDWSYWMRAPCGDQGGKQPRPISWRTGWSGAGSPSNGLGINNATVRNALDCYCTGSRWCAVAAHSTGAAQIGYALSLYGGTQRPLTNGVSVGGTCTGTGGTQTGWNIKFVAAAGGAEGGSEAAEVGINLSLGLNDNPILWDLVPTTMRAKYDHNETFSENFHLYVGANGGWGSVDLPGEDDGVVAYHSAGGVSGWKGRDYCNPRAWLCPTLTKDYGNTSDGQAKWTNHTVRFRDDKQVHTHSADYFHGPTSQMMLYLQAAAY